MDQARGLPPFLPVLFLAQYAWERENLLLAGRCISGDFASHASCRMTGTAVTLSEAVELAEAWSGCSGKAPYLWKDVSCFSPEEDI